MQRLSQLLEGIYCDPLPVDPMITGLSQDTRSLQPGDLFFAYPGQQVDGRLFLQEAILKQAAAVLFEADGREQLTHWPESSIPLIPLAHLSAYLGPIAAKFYGQPSRELSVVGVTGTNGKTSCTHFIAQCLEQLHQTCGVIGTLGYGLYGHLTPGALTTPDAIELQRLLSELRAQKAEIIAVEVSSHRLAQQRLNGMNFSVAAFTNLTQDHLDYHGDLSHYARAKRSLFDLSGLQHAVLNADDAYGQAWLSELSGYLPLTAYSLMQPRRAVAHIPHVSVKRYDLHHMGLRAEITSPWGDCVIDNPFLIGQFNLSNLLLVFAVLAVLQFGVQEIARVISQVKGVPGRLQVFRMPQKPWVVVDYAHTPDALEQALKSLRAYCKGRLYCVFGCGGERDKGKRALMAKVAEQHADVVILTQDNPRFEDPEQIIQDIQLGFSGKRSVHVELDRRLAIRYAIHNADTKDIVLIAGKGHEPYQLIAGVKHPLSDIEEVQSTLGRASISQK